MGFGVKRSFVHHYWNVQGRSFEPLHVVRQQGNQAALVNYTIHTEGRKYKILWKVWASTEDSTQKGIVRKSQAGHLRPFLTVPDLSTRFVPRKQHPREKALPPPHNFGSKIVVLSTTCDGTSQVLGRWDMSPLISQRPKPGGDVTCCAKRNSFWAQFAGGSKEKS